MVIRASRAGHAPGCECLVEQVRHVSTRDGQRLALTEVTVPGRPRADGPAFLLVHGFAQNRRAYTLGPMPRELAERGARVFLGELRGHGDSRVDDAHVWSMQTHLDHDLPALIEAVRQETGVARIHLVGHSMGGLLGAALLTRSAPLASLSAMATPLLLGAARPLVRLASFVVGPFATLARTTRRVPIDLLLGALADPLSAPGARGPLRLLQRVTRLANPAAAPYSALREILSTADSESPVVMEELARNAVLLRPRIAGVDLTTAVQKSKIPIAAVCGSADIFAPRAAVAPLESEGQAGPRHVIELPGVTHVDAIMGHHIPETVSEVWDFLDRSGAFSPA